MAGAAIVVGLLQCVLGAAVLGAFSEPRRSQDVRIRIDAEVLDRRDPVELIVLDPSASTAPEGAPTSPSALRRQRQCAALVWSGVMTVALGISVAAM